MKTTIKHVAPWLAAAAVGGALFLAPVASAATAAPTAPDSGACTAPGYGQVFGQESGCTAPNGTTSSGANLPYNDAGNSYQHAGAV